MSLRDEVAQMIARFRHVQMELTYGQRRVSAMAIDKQLADRILDLLRNPGDLGNCPRFVAGEYSRRNIEAFIGDATSISTHSEDTL